MDGWKTTFLVGRLGLFSGKLAVSFREGTFFRDVYVAPRFSSEPTKSPPTGPTSTAEGNQPLGFFLAGAAPALGSQKGSKSWDFRASKSGDDFFPEFSRGSSKMTPDPQTSLHY